jgi:hypothetical protein
MIALSIDNGEMANPGTLKRSIAQTKESRTKPIKKST